MDTIRNQQIDLTNIYDKKPVVIRYEDFLDKELDKMVQEFQPYRCVVCEGIISDNNDLSVHLSEHQVEVTTENGGKKNDQGKPPMALLSSTFLFEVAKVLDFGSKKYNPWNWKGGFVWSRVISAVLRHIFQWLGGEDKDSETGLSHLAHAACGLMFLIDFEVNKLGTDDRYKKG
jgi:hypothetical protein